MRFCAVLLSSILVTGASLPLSLFAQDDQTTQKPDPTQASPVQTQPATVPTNDQPQSAAEQGKTEGSGVKHDGSKKDVGAIGDRKMGGFDMYPIETDIKIGKAYAEQIDQVVKLVQDPRISEYGEPGRPESGPQL